MSNKKLSYIINEKLKDKEKDKENDEKKPLETSEKSQDKNVKTFSQESSNDMKKLTVSEALEKANEIADKYKKGDYLNTPDSLGLEKVDVPSKSKEDIKKQANELVSDKYETSKEKSNSSFDNKIDEILKSNQNLLAKNEQNKKDINAYYDSSKKETENQALKRGLARSSIVIGELATIENSRANELANLLSTFQNTLDENEKQIQKYANEKEQAIEELDIKKALEIEQKISSISEEYEKTKKDAISFYNNVEKLEAEYKLSLEKQKQEKQREALKMQKTYGTNYLEEEMKQKQYDFLKNYLDSLEPSYALSILLTNKEFKSMLQDKYTKLYKYIADKA